LSTCGRAVLRNALGEHLETLDPGEIECYEFLAERGEVIRSQKMKKGKLQIIFRLKAPKEPPVDPSSSRNSDCSLSENDARAIAGLFAEPTRRQIERWLGWGLLTS
jgi:hypothetical protein